MKRREFLYGSAAAAVAAGAWAQGPDRSKLDRIGIMTNSFNTVLKLPGRPEDPKRTMEVLDFAGIMAERYGVHLVEYQSTDFPSTEPEYFREFHSRIEEAKSRMIQINLEFGSDLNVSAPDPRNRLLNIDLSKRWIDHAITLGCPRVMVFQGSLAPEVRHSVIESLKRIKAYAKEKNVFLTMEPRWTPTGNLPAWDVLLEVVKASGIHFNPDCGNFPDNKSRMAALAIFYTMTAGSSHFKDIPERFPTAEAIDLAKRVGYKGIFSIEAGRQNGPDPYVAVQNMLDLVLRLI